VFSSAREDNIEKIFSALRVMDVVARRSHPRDGRSRAVAGAQRAFDARSKRAFNMRLTILIVTPPVL